MDDYNEIFEFSIRTSLDDQVTIGRITKEKFPEQIRKKKNDVNEEAEKLSLDFNVDITKHTS